MSNVGATLVKLERDIDRLLRQQQAVVEEHFPVGSEVTVLKNSEKGWRAVVVRHTHGTDLVVRNTRTGSEQCVGINWIKEARP